MLLLCPIFVWFPRLPQTGSITVDWGGKCPAGAEFVLFELPNIKRRDFYDGLSRFDGDAFDGIGAGIPEGDGEG